MSHTSGENYDPTTGIWNVGNLNNAQTKILNITVLVNATGVYRNDASVIIFPENEDETLQGNNTDSATTIPVPKSDLEITKTNPFEVLDAAGNPKPVKEHEKVIYTITVHNNGPSDIVSASVTEQLPAGLTYLSYNTLKGTYNPITGIWSVGSLSNQEEVTLYIVAVINGKEEVPTNTVIVKEDTDILDPDTNNNTAISEVTYNKDCELRIYNYVSANNDGYNDYFIIENIDCYPDNTVEIYNRWGVQVYKTTGYGTAVSQNVFTGISDGRATVSQDKTLPEGTYFYVIQYKGTPGSGSKSGYLELTR